jgi:hypothetical protein
MKICFPSKPSSFMPKQSNAFDFVKKNIPLKKKNGMADMQI